MKNFKFRIELHKLDTTLINYVLVPNFGRCRHSDRYRLCDTSHARRAIDDNICCELAQSVQN